MLGRKKAAHRRLAPGWSRLVGRPRELPPFKLALQGGGAHGAFTWGVLDRLLEEADFHVDAVSGTSAGAINAVALASGWLAGGRVGARKALRDLWQAIADLARVARARQGALPQIALDLTAQLLSPYQLNPLGMNPLRDVLERQIDFEALRRAARPRVMVAATVVETGEPVIFEGPALGAQAVLASACLPQVYQAIEIEGRAHWDGGYVCNPPLVALAERAGPPDLLLVQINPLAHRAAPRSAADIRNRIGEIVFGRPLEHELAELARHAERSRLLRTLDPRRRMRRLARQTLHHIDGSAELSRLDPATKIMADAANLNDLGQRGRNAAEAWLTGYRDGPQRVPAAAGEAATIPADAAA